MVYSPTFQASQPPPTHIHTHTNTTSASIPPAPRPPLIAKRESKALTIFDRDNKVVKPSGSSSTGTTTAGSTTSASSTPRSSPALSPATATTGKGAVPPLPGGLPPQAAPKGGATHTHTHTTKAKVPTLTAAAAAEKEKKEKEDVVAVSREGEKEKEKVAAPAPAPAPVPAQAVAVASKEGETKAVGAAVAAVAAAAVANGTTDETEKEKEKVKAATDSVDTAASKLADLSLATPTPTTTTTSTPSPSTTPETPTTVPESATEEAAPASPSSTSPPTHTHTHPKNGKVIYHKTDLERLKPTNIDEPSSLTGKLIITKPSTSSLSESGSSSNLSGSNTSLGLGLGRKLGLGNLSRSGGGSSTHPHSQTHTPTQEEGGAWQRKSLPTERKSSDSLSGSTSRGGGQNTPSPGGGGGGGGAWRRGEALPSKQQHSHAHNQNQQQGQNFRAPSHHFSREQEKIGLKRAGGNAWCPTRDTSALEQCEAKVRGILNKMTWDTFEKLSTQLCSVELDSKDMLSKIISLVFDKAVDEPNFGEMYAELCVDVSKKSGEWSVVRTGVNLEKEGGGGGGKYFWTDDIMVEKEIVGPFPSRDACIEAAVSKTEPRAQARTQKLRLSELVIKGDKFIKILESMEGGGVAQQFYTVFRSLSEEEEGQEKVIDRIHGGFEDDESALQDGYRATTFKKLLLKKCQDEFYKKDIYESVGKAGGGEGGKNLTRQELALQAAEEEEGRMKAKRRMLGNIRFIGELYKKKMLKEHIMHECILKLMGLEEEKRKSDKDKDRKLVRVHPWDEESLEALCKLLTTVGKQLDDVKTGDSVKGRPPPEFHHKDLAFYYEKLRELSIDKKSGMPTRARFMIKDLLELRENKWVPRRMEAKATKTDEFRREVDALQKPGMGPLGGGGGGGGGKGGGGGGGGRGPASPPLQRQGSNNSDKSGGRGGGDKRPARGSGGERDSGGGGGRDRRGSIPPGALDRRGSRPGAPSPSEGLEGGGDERIHTERGGRGSLSSLGEGSRSGGNAAAAAAGAGAAAAGAASMPRDKVERLISGLISEFLELKNEAEVDASLAAVPLNMGSEVAANTLLAKLCDCRDAERAVLMQLLLHMVKTERILSLHLRQQVQLVLETLEDVCVDVPHVFENFAFAIAALLRTKALEFAWFQKEARKALPLPDGEGAFTRLMVAVFRAFDADRRAPWSWDLVKAGGPVLFEAYRDRESFMRFVAEHQLWATYVDPLSARIVEEARAGNGTNGILAWVRSLEPSLRNNVPFTRALAYRLLVECPKVTRTYWPQPAELRTLFAEISQGADARLQVACLHGIQRFVNESAGVQERKAMLVNLFEELMHSGAVLPGTLSAWEQDLRDTSDRALAEGVVGEVMGKLGLGAV